MAKKISQLTQATQVKSDDVTVIVQDGETKKLPLNMMVTKQDIENKKVTGLAKLDEIEATCENDTYTPTITVKNKSSVKVGEGDEVDYSANVMDGPAKSAILKGQTLVNLTSNDEIYYQKVPTGNWTDYPSAIDARRCSICIKNIKPNTRYIVKTLSETKQFYARFYNNKLTTTNGNTGWININSIFTTLSDTDKMYISFRLSDENEDYTDISQCSNILLLEYQEGMENWDIPYFEGMQSVKMPVLTTTGKNLFNLPLVQGSQTYGTIGGKPIHEIYSNRVTNEPNKYIKVKPNTQITFSIINNDVRFAIAELDEHGNRLGDTGWLETVSQKTITTKSSTHYIGFNFKKVGGTDITVEEVINSNPMFEYSNTSTSYEPYKTNILTVNEDVELGSVGNVYDTLDLLTGKVIKRTETYTYKGETEPYLNSSIGGYVVHVGANANVTLSTGIISDKFINRSFTNNDTGVYGNNNGVFYFFDKLVTSAQEFKEKYIGTTFRFELKEESIKTVDLMPSGTHPSTTPYCWKNGHIQLSSSGLLPNLEYSVVTSRAGQINQNATMIVKNDKRIFDLEILLAGGLVNTTYQALTLQNQVETGLSKVSLNSETEPDYLLYHMIMKLIEEKAYKLDDLTEKVSVFYLYEKLSDEQFETIYSALYPFAEDEYDELSEEAENEVVMQWQATFIK